MNNNIYSKIDWPSQRHEYISAFIEPGMIRAWLSCDCTLEELYLLCRKRGMGSELLYSEFADTFLLIAEHF